jgi:hypothetical protein
MFFVLCQRADQPAINFACRSLAEATEQLWECIGSGEYTNVRITQEAPQESVRVHVVRPAAYVIYDERQ